MKAINAIKPLFLLHILLGKGYCPYFAFKAAIDAAQSRMP
jgi:hypothetical protein